MGAIRISLRANCASKRRKTSVAASVLIKPTFDAIREKAKHKPKLTKKEYHQCRLFVFEGTARAKAGTELLRGHDLTDLLGNDTTISVAVGENFISRSGIQVQSSKVIRLIEPEGPGILEVCPAEILAAVAGDEEQQSAANEEGGNAHGGRSDCIKISGCAGLLRTLSMRCELSMLFRSKASPNFDHPSHERILSIRQFRSPRATSR